MEYIKIPLHGKYGKGKYTLVDGDYDGEYFSQYKWYLLSNGYAGRDGRYETGKSSYIYLHKEVCPHKRGWVADHIDRDKLNNRSCNLRLVTPRGNANNRPQPRNRHNSHGYRGVSLKNRPGTKNWYASISGKYIGIYYTPQEAALAYNKKAKELYGEDAILNVLN